jgi:hypothetical protein
MGAEEVLWYKVMVGDLIEEDQLEYLGLDGRIILIWILKK